MAEAETKEAQLIADFIVWVEGFTGKLPADQCDAMFDLYGRARAIQHRAAIQRAEA